MATEWGDVVADPYPAGQEVQMVNTRRLGTMAVLGGMVMAGVAGVPHPAQAWIGVYGGPVYVAPPPMYYGPRVYVAPPPPVYYARPPAVYYAPRPRVWIPPHWEGPYWVRGHWS
jgi:hypothetical protein